ncbi:hypothetical protein E2542_SST23343 [Spatholobus suberectus]|nr:hypothetical protein E2542_SST23343 [Spatholobus suberectus]
MDRTYFLYSLSAVLERLRVLIQEKVEMEGMRLRVPLAVVQEEDDEGGRGDIKKRGTNQEIQRHKPKRHRIRGAIHLFSSVASHRCFR